MLSSYTSKWSSNVHCVSRHNLFQAFSGIPTYPCFFFLKKTIMLVLCVSVSDSLSKISGTGGHIAMLLSPAWRALPGELYKLHNKQKEHMVREKTTLNFLTVDAWKLRPSLHSYTIFNGLSKCGMSQHPWCKLGCWRNSAVVLLHLFTSIKSFIGWVGEQGSLWRASPAEFINPFMNGTVGQNSVFVLYMLHFFHQRKRALPGEFISPFVNEFTTSQ